MIKKIDAKSLGKYSSQKKYFLHGHLTQSAEPDTGLWYTD
jgi:hypothetical protein